MKKKQIRQAIAALALGACAVAPAAAETIYRCGDTYSQQPCPNARAIETSTAPVSSEAARAARQAAQRDAALSDVMEKARLRDDAKPAAAYIPVAGPARADGKTSAESKSVMNNGYTPHTFSAVAAGETKGKKNKKEKTEKKTKSTAADKKKAPQSSKTVHGSSSAKTRKAT